MRKACEDRASGERGLEEHVAAKQSLHITRKTPEQEAREETPRARFAQRLREALTSVKDPEARAKIEEELTRLEGPSPAIEHNQAVEIYNEAVDRANKRDYAQAIALLEDLFQQPVK